MLLLLLSLGAARATAGEGLWSLSLRTQGFLDFKPGNDFFLGPQLGYSNFWMAAHRFELKAAYLTTRWESAYRNVLKYDQFLFSPTWHFRRDAIFDPTLQVDVGYARYDTEFEIFEDLPNTTWLVSVQPGLSFNFFGGAYSLHYHLGYNFITPQGHLFQPAFFGLGLVKML